MLTKKDRAVAERFRRRVADVLPVIAVRAFGSRVRRRHAPDSDLDIFIEAESVTPEQRRQQHGSHPRLPRLALPQQRAEQGQQDPRATAAHHRS